jgi:hypothetical protein
MGRWLQDVDPESESGRLTSVADKSRGETRVAAIRKVSMMGDGAYMDDVSKLLARQVLGMELHKFPGEAKEWPTFITSYRRTTVDCGFSESESMERLRKCLSDPAKHCVWMVLLTNDADVGEEFWRVEQNHWTATGRSKASIKREKLERFSRVFKLGEESNRDRGKCRRRCKFSKQQRDQRAVEEIAWVPAFTVGTTFDAESDSWHQHLPVCCMGQW